jgi:hypothetical protein
MTMQIITLFCVAQRDVTLRSAASPEPSPGNTGTACLWRDVGRRGAQGGAGNKQDWRMGRAHKAACDGKGLAIWHGNGFV